MAALPLLALLTAAFSGRSPAALPRARTPAISLQLFPPASIPEPATSDRSAKMAALIHRLADSYSFDFPAEADELLRSHRAFLLAPFVGHPECGSIYGDGSTEDKVQRYVSSLNERIEKAHAIPTGSRLAAALARMRDYVVAELEPAGAARASASLATLTRLRGGTVRARLHSGLDAVVDQCVNLADTFVDIRRSTIEPPNVFDALVTGTFTGLLFGAYFFREYKRSTIVFASAFAITHTFPERIPPIAVNVVIASSEQVGRARRTVLRRLKSK